MPYRLHIKFQAHNMFNIVRYERHWLKTLLLLFGALALAGRSFTMVLVSEQQHANSLNFRNQRKVVLLRDVKKTNGKKRSWVEIAREVKNLNKKHPSPWLVRNTYNDFDTKLGHVPYNYSNCGRTAEKATPAVKQFLVRKLLGLRQKNIVTSVVLQKELLLERDVELEASYIRKILKEKGYTWLPRSQKAKYTKEVMLKRLRFAKFVLSKTDRQLRERLSFSLDGIVLTVPPQHEVDRENYCRYGDTHMYRKKDEGCKPELAGDNPFAKQVPMNRAIPMWGGISAGGFRHVVYHADRKLNEDEWSELVEKGKLVEAVKGLNPVSARGPWWVIVDNESFLRTDLSKAAYRKQKIKLWSIPPKSPDLNPVEKFWAWVRKQLRARDFADLRARRKVLGKTAYTLRVKKLLRSARSQQVASNVALGFKRVCKQVVKNKGAASKA